jgi:hypothetical protein
MHPHTAAQQLEEVSHLGREKYEQIVQPSLRSEDIGQFVAIDVDSGEYEIDPDDYTAAERLRQRRPSARIWLARAGDRAAYRIGGRWRPEGPK